VKPHPLLEIFVIIGALEEKN